MSKKSACLTGYSEDNKLDIAHKAVSSLCVDAD